MSRVHAVVQHQHILRQGVAVALDPIESRARGGPFEIPSEKPTFEVAAPRPTQHAMRDAAGLADAVRVQALSEAMDLPAFAGKTLRPLKDAGRGAAVAVEPPAGDGDLLGMIH